LTQERPNIFTQHVANILPGGEIVIEIRYLEDLPLLKDSYRFVFPMVVGPRFHPPGEVPDAHRVPSEPTEYLAPDARPGNDISVEVRLDAGMPFRLFSPSHRLDGAHDGGPFALVRLDPADTIPNKDFVLEWNVVGDAPRVAVHVHRADQGGFFTLMVQPEVDPAAEVVAGREMIFVLDCSGSMSGAPIETAKAVIERTLKTLRPDDTFQVLRFSEEASGLWKEPRQANPADVAAALDYVRRLRGHGGTMMIEGIKAALSGPRDPERIRIVHFLTDGYIGNESQILREIHRRCGEARIFPLGVGSSVNRYLIDRMAEAGRGAPAYIRQDAAQERIRIEVDRFVERVRRPTLVDLEIDWGGLPVEDLVPARIPDLFVGQPVFVHGRFTEAAEGEVVLRGRRAGQPYEKRVPLVFPTRAETNASLAPRWARAVIARLGSSAEKEGGDLLKELVTHLGLEFRLMTKYTAFVAVEETVVVENGETRTVREPLPLPEGTQWDGFFGQRANSTGALSFASRRQAAAPSGPTTPAMPRGGGGQFRGPSGGVPPGLRGPSDPGEPGAVRKSPQDGKALALRLLEASTRGEKAVVLDKLVEKLLSAQRQRSPSGLDQALACLALLDYRSGPAHAGAAAGLRRLVTLQREDGGWAAKADSQSDPLATALALLALARGKQ
ncbi:MAG: VWA domain-containing protein, partial [Planctomycetota bacterium]